MCQNDCICDRVVSSRGIPAESICVTASIFYCQAGRCELTGGTQVHTDTAAVEYIHILSFPLCFIWFDSIQIMVFVSIYLDVKCIIFVSPFIFVLKKVPTSVNTESEGFCLIFVLNVGNMY